MSGANHRISIHAAKNVVLYNKDHIVDHAPDLHIQQMAVGPIMFDSFKGPKDAY